jgi:iron complex outermembrane receptor protein
MPALRARLPKAAAWSVWILTCALWLSEPAAAQRPGRLTGSVKDATGLPLVGVTMTVRGAVERFAQTGPDGRFAFHDLPPGEYELVAALPGFATARRTVRVREGEIGVSLELSVLIVERIAVTATKTGELDVLAAPVAVSVLGARDLARVEAHTVAHIAGLAPSVTFSQNTDFAQLTIRGIGTNAVFAGSDPSSAVYVDGVYLARPAMALGDFLDIERVEVLRGPQGTLYGRNAVGGAVNVITRAPTDTFEFSARLIGGNHDMFRSEAQVSGPIIRGRMSGRAAVLRGVRRGFVRDVNHPDTRLGGEDVTRVRGQVGIVLNRRSHVLISADVSHQDPTPLTWAKVLMVKPGFQVDNPSSLYDVRASTVADGRNVQYGGLARFSLNLTPTTRLSSLSAYRSLEYDRLVDTDVTELELNATRIHEMQRQISEEVTISGQSATLDWIGGAFLFHEIDRQPTDIRMAAADRHNQLDPRVEASSVAGFGQATTRFHSRFSVTAGLRYTREHKSIDNAGRIVTLASPSTTLPGSAYDYTDTRSDTAWTPKFALEVRARNTLAYVSATRGFKSGGFTLTSTEVGRGYAPEWAWSYEVGLKRLLPASDTRIHVAAFHTNYTDLQVSAGIRPGVIDVTNAAASTIRGIELEATTRIVGGLKAGGHVSWTSARYDRYIAVGTGGVTADVAGHRLNNVPEWSGRLWLEWNRDLPGATSLSILADARRQSTVFFTPFNDTIQRQPAYGLLDVSAEFGPQHRRWSLSAYSRNLTNAGYITGTFGTPLPAIGGRPGDPRQVGFQVAIRS